MVRRNIIDQLDATGDADWRSSTAMACIPDEMANSERTAMPVIYIFSHDSIGVGEDGPPHQPVEQLIGLRAISRPDHAPAS